MTDEQRGIYRKYTVTRNGDPEGKHVNCDYFVLDWEHDRFAVVAARAYADACETLYPKLAADLRRRAGLEVEKWFVRDSVAKVKP